MKWIFPASLLIALCGPAAQAQSSITAASCNESDVNAVINGPTHKAVSGDTISIPSGSCTWTSGISISGVGISIIGAGTPNVGAGTFGAGTSTTVITDNMGGGATPLFKVTGIVNGQTMRISMLQLQPAPGVTSSGSPVLVIGTCNSSGCPNLRVDNVTFPSSWTPVNLTGSALIGAENVFGVLDHNTVIATSPSFSLLLVSIIHSSWQGVGQYGDNSWATPDTFGTAQALFVENNLLTGARATNNYAGDLFQNSGGGRQVCRYNNFTSQAPDGACTNHGTDSTGRPRSARQMEAYGNSITCLNPSGCDAAIGINGGAGLIYNNTLTAVSGSFFNAYAVFDAERSYRGPVGPWNMCDGTGPWDKNDGTEYGSGIVTSSGTGTFSVSVANLLTNQWAGSAVTNGTPYSIHDLTQNFGAEISSNTATQYAFASAPENNNPSPYTWNVSDSYQILRATVCVDQPGRGQGTLLSGTTPTPTGWVNDVLDPIYEWGDTHSGNFGSTPVVARNTKRLLNNRDYYYQVSPNAQTSPTSPFNGTVGTGYGTLGNRPTTCAPTVAYWATDQNTLYKCTTTDTWTEFYRPYTYPHPLTTGSTSGTSVNPPQNLTLTVQ